MTKKSQVVSTILEPLQEDERRAFTEAAKDLVRLKLEYVAATNNIQKENIYVWLKGRPASLSLEKQKLLMSLFGLTPWGQLIDNVLHTWVVDGREGAPLAELLLSREAVMNEAVLSLAYTAKPSGRQLIGAEICWTAPNIMSHGSETQNRRLIITAMAGSWDDDDFVDWISGLVGGRIKKRITEKELKSNCLDVSNLAATNIWRYYHAGHRMVGGSRILKPPYKGLLPFNQDIVAEQSARESPVAVLQDIAPRFRALTVDHAKLRGVRVSPKDLALLRRAEEATSETSQTS